MKPRVVGLIDEMKLQVFSMLGMLMEHVQQVQHDEKRRHFIVMILTDEGPDYLAGGRHISTDLVSSMDAEETHEALRDWLKRKTQ